MCENAAAERGGDRAEAWSTSDEKPRVELAGGVDDGAARPLGCPLDATGSSTGANYYTRGDSEELLAERAASGKRHLEPRRPRHS